MNIDEEIEQEARSLYPNRDIHRHAFKKGVKWGVALFLTTYGCHLCDEKGSRYDGVLVENGKWVCRLCVDAMIEENQTLKADNNEMHSLLHASPECPPFCTCKECTNAPENID
jgi:hypothetical protein